MKQPARGTLAVWGGELGGFAERATQVPVHHGVSFRYPDVDEWLDVALGRRPGHIYGRNTNPTVAVFEEKVRLLEGGDAATSATTGMGIISSTLFALLSPGDRVVATKDTYGGTNRLLREILPRFGVEVKLCEGGDTDGLESTAAAGCTLLYLETPTNPLLRVVDVARLARAASSAGALTVVDSTVATPVNQRPLELGADLVVHSATKYLGGHADALGGVACGRKDLVDRVFAFREIAGGSLHPEAAYLLLRGMKTLEIRVQRQNASALEIARFLHGHTAVARVHYPGLASDPGHEVARRQMSGFGGLLSFELADPSFDAVRRLVPRLRYAHAAANLGAVETIVGPPATTSHVECSAEERAAMGIPESLIRYSVGIEDVRDLVADLDRALAGVTPP